MVLTEEQIKAMKTNEIKEYLIGFNIYKSDPDKDLTLRLGFEEVARTVGTYLGILVDKHPGECTPPALKSTLSDDYGYTIEVRVTKVEE